MREIKSQVVEYLRKVQVLNGNPEVINLPENFQNILQNIPIATNQTMQQKAMQEISNSNDETIIMIASGWGHRGVGYLAANKPNTKGLLISSPRIEKRFPDFLFRHIPNLENYLVF
ncbi:hypothetical protein HN789_03820 [archaeon]|nr:hypothetical protein [archaeon]MBT3721015.1 hypothetical protein [archaeon]MBT4023091.1 hypothetical protein [archaeon]MBT4272489.1 hypothetical protein [archaeon]MBT4460587.1 hypothetical protein [archaeon]